MRLVATSTRDRFAVVPPTEPAINWRELSDEQIAGYWAGTDVPLASETPLLHDRVVIVEIRALGPSETFALQPMLPRTSLTLIEAFASGQKMSEQPTEVQGEYYSLARGRALLFGRAGIVRVTAGIDPSRLPPARVPCGALEIWPEAIVSVLGAEAVMWLGSLVERLTQPIDPEKKSGSGSSPTATAGTTPASTATASDARAS